MTKNQFIKVLHHFPESSSAEEARGILALKEQYPYSQVLHALAARVSDEHEFPFRQQELQTAAVYACDRAVLKEIMSRKAEVWPVSSEVIGQNHSVTPESIETNQLHTGDESGDLAEEVLQDLHRLSELKHNFEVMFVDIREAARREKQPEAEEEEEEDTGDDTDEVDIENTDDEDKETKKKTPPLRRKTTGKSKAQRIIELAKALEEDDAATAAEHDGPEDTIISEIKNSKKKINPENEKQREQLEIIDQFIKTQPSITSARDKERVQPSAGDLSSIKSGEFGDNVISETLVDILLRQGKKDKAIEVLKKLIWKFPQKKAYFAAQIEDLKK